MTDIIIAAVIILIIGLASAYIIRAKKSGAKCIGCAYAKKCASAKGGECSCCSSNKNTEN